MPIRKRVEAGFTALGQSMIRWRWLAIGAMVLLTAGLGSLLPQVRVDNSEEAFLHGDDPERRRYDRFRDQFGREDRINVLLRPGQVLDLDFLETLRRLQEEVEAEVPYVEETTSLVNARNTRGEGDELIVEDLLETWPESEADLTVLRERVLSNPLYVDILISADAQYAMLSVKPLTYTTLGVEEDALDGFDAADGVGDRERPPYLSESESHALVEKLTEVSSRYRSEALGVWVVGGPAIDYALTQTMQSDVTVFLGLALAVITGLLLLLFRRISGVVMPVTIVVCAMVASMGMMALLDIPFSITLNILPAFLMVVGVCDSVHILVIVYQRLEEGDTREDAIVYAMGHSGLAIVMTSLTTAAGLMSFSVAELAPIAQLGVIAPIGVLLAMTYSLVLLPALLAITPLRAMGMGQTRQTDRLSGRFLARVGDVAATHPVRVLVATGAIALVGLGGLSQVRFSHDGLRWFPEHDPLRVGAEIIDAEFRGASTLEVITYTGEENGLHDPLLLARIETAMDRSAAFDVGGRPVGKATSIVDVVKEINQALNENDATYYALPEGRQLIAQELLLFENSGSDDLEDLTDTQFSMGRISIRTPWVDAMLYPGFVEDMDGMLREVLGEEARFELTGGAVIFTTLFKAVILTMARSYVLALLIITPLLVLLVGNLKRGLLAMIPNLLPVYLVLCFMGWRGIPLDASTLLIGGIVLGVAVDDTIHFMHNFNRYFEDYGDSRLAVRETLRTTGSAMLFTSLVLSLGFAVFLASYLNNTYWFGLLTALATGVAFFADILVAPALMVLATRSVTRR